MDDAPRAFTIANFNQVMKVSPDIFQVWAGAMLRTSGVHLMLLSGVTSVHVQYPAAGRNLRAEVAVRGLQVGRLVRGPVLRKHEHLVRASRCDLAVDTLSYNSHTTGSDALWAGLPLLTQPGRNFASRVASSLTTSIGLASGHVHSLKAYEDLIHMLASPSSSSKATAASGVRSSLDATASGHVRSTIEEAARRNVYGTSALLYDQAHHQSDSQLADLVGPRPWGTRPKSSVSGL